MAPSVQMPKLSVILSLTAFCEGIEGSLASIAAQSYKNTEYVLLVYDEGVYETHKALIEKFIARKGNSKVRIMTEKQSRFDGARFAAGDYLLFANIGDIYSEDWFVGMVSRAEESSADLVMSETAIIYKNANIFEYVFDYAKSFDKTITLNDIAASDGYFWGWNWLGNKLISAKLYRRVRVELGPAQEAPPVSLSDVLLCAALMYRAGETAVCRGCFAVMSWGNEDNSIKNSMSAHRKVVSAMSASMEVLSDYCAKSGVAEDAADRLCRAFVRRFYWRSDWTLSQAKLNDYKADLAAFIASDNLSRSYKDARYDDSLSRVSIIVPEPADALYERLAKNTNVREYVSFDGFVSEYESFENDGKIGVVAVLAQADFCAALEIYAFYLELEQNGYRPVLFNLPLDSGDEGLSADAARFIAEKMKIFPVLKTKEDYFSAVNSCDAFVAYGDVFNYDKVGSSGHYYLLDFINDKKKIIVSSSDLQNITAPLSYISETKVYLNNCDAVLAGGTYAAKQIKERFGVKACELSPLLATGLKRLASDFSVMSEEKYTAASEEKYIAVCFNEPDNAFVTRSLDVYYDIGDCPSVEDKLRLLIDSEYILTDSFGIIKLALAFEKSFYAVVSHDGDIFEEFLKEYGLSDRIIYIDGRNSIKQQRTFTHIANFQAVNQKIKWRKEKTLSDFYRLLRGKQAVKGALPPNEHFVPRGMLPRKSFRLQNVVFPDCDWKNEYSGLFYRSNIKNAIRRAENKGWIVEPCFIEFFTYFNSFSLRKWRKYTGLSRFELHIKAAGKFRAQLFAHYFKPKYDGKHKYDSLTEQFDEIRSLDVSDTAKRDFFFHAAWGSDAAKDFSREYAFESSTPVEDEEFIVPIVFDGKVSVVGFQLRADKPFTISEAYFSADCYEDEINDVNISICTTTFKKEKYIRENIQFVNDEIFNSSRTGGLEDLSFHLFYNIVDNGRTLIPCDINGYNLQVHPNPNTGGAGGFTRGMLETLSLKEKGAFDATHIIFMDDDIKIMPESIKRTYALLRLMREEYRGYFISGAFLREEQMNIQQEDIGFVSETTNFWMPQKFRLDVSDWYNVLINEENFDQKNQYAAWWYCCIPISYIRDGNLSLPLFFRTDDIEFSLRNNIRALTMNGICVWHMSGEKKYNPVYDKYMTLRNLLFIKAVSGIASTADFYGEIKKEFYIAIRAFNYVNAGFILQGIDDFLKGPEFFATADWEEILSSLGAKREKYLPLAYYSDIPVNLESISIKESLSDADMELFLGTDNGHKCPKYVLRKEIGVIPYDFMENPGQQLLKKRLLAVNPHDKTAALREIDTERYAELMERYEKLTADYEERIAELTEEYREYAKIYRSADFWRKYLGLI
jgi:GT2 family glycosyltransferase